VKVEISATAENQSLVIPPIASHFSDLDILNNASFHILSKSSFIIILYFDAIWTYAVEEV